MHAICRLSELPLSSGRRAYLPDGREIALFVLGDEEVVAIDNVCPHQHFPLLHEGEIDDDCVSCPMHGWRFDLRTGECREGGGEARVETYRTEIIDGIVHVEIGPKKRASWEE